ncbi:MAG: phosphonoacetate hydrolase [Burkholderiales bacterium]|nr:phosphonoacetate hydrolase [Burkholderiales bacterium]
MPQETPTVVVNGTPYAWPGRPLAVVVIDGGDPAYLQRFLAEGAIPNVARFMQEGFAVVAEGTVPSFTCPNNMSIVTGTPASRHGISGNFYLDTATGEAVVMTGPELLRGDTILKGFADAGAKVVAITAKDKLRRQLGKGLDLSRGNVCFSSEKADKCTLAENGIEDVLAFVGQPLPDMYSMELSLFVLDAGIRLLEAGPRDLLFLSLTDWVQHKYAPHEAEARRFYQELDRRFGRLAALGATVVLTADHGMNDKSNEAGEPNVIWLQDILDARFGKGDTRVICPITDAFVAHHGALGGFVRVWCRGKATPAQVIEAIRGLPGLESVLDKETACRLFDLPADREGDVVVISTSNVCVGASEKDHDLSGLKGHRLRTHGGTTEAKVPLIISRPLNGEYKLRGGSGVLKSWQLFDFALNGVAR